MGRLPQSYDIQAGGQRGAEPSPLSARRSADVEFEELLKLRAGEPRVLAALQTEAARTHDPRFFDAIAAFAPEWLASHLPAGPDIDPMYWIGQAPRDKRNVLVEAIAAAAQPTSRAPSSPCSIRPQRNNGGRSWSSASHGTQCLPGRSPKHVARNQSDLQRNRPGGDVLTPQQQSRGLDGFDETEFRLRAGLQNLWGRRTGCGPGLLRRSFLK